MFGTIVRLAIFALVAAVAVWQMALWISQGRKRPEYGTTKFPIMLANNVSMWMVVVVFAAAGLVFGDLWELLLVPIGVLVVLDLTNLAEWWVLDLVDEYGDSINGYEARSNHRLFVKVVPMQFASLMAEFALLGTAAHLTGNGELQFVSWVIAVGCGVVWILAYPIGLVLAARRRG
ncbi:MAG TPA: hypothetical protein VEZ14_04295 [Dehalococcoidia bacterium]|nr:hypothetical protein [Dehalococcoidia bacterium]